MIVVLLVACGGSQPAKRNPADPCHRECTVTSVTAAIGNDCAECKRAYEPWSLTCEERCSFESEWYVGCVSGCRSMAQPVFARDAGVAVPPD